MLLRTLTELRAKTQRHLARPVRASHPQTGGRQSNARNRDGAMLRARASLRRELAELEGVSSSSRKMMRYAIG